MMTMMMTMIQGDTEVDLGHHELIAVTRDHHTEEGHRRLITVLGKRCLLIVA